MVRPEAAAGAKPLVRPYTGHAEDHLSRVVYERGSRVLAHLRDLVGDIAFWSGMQAWLERFGDHSGRCSDFISVMEEAAGCDLTAFESQWLRRAEHPVLELAVRGGAVRYRQIGEGEPFRFDLCVAVDGGLHRAPVDAAHGELQIPAVELWAFADPCCSSPGEIRWLERPRAWLARS